MQWCVMLWLWICGWLYADDTKPSTETSVDDTTEETEAPATETETLPIANEEIIVYGQKEVDRRRKQLENQLYDQGYREGIHRGNKVIYRPDVVWYPSVVIYNSGWVDLRKTPPRFEPWIRGNPNNPWRYVSCIPPFTFMCIKASGWLITKRRAQHSKTAVIEKNIDGIRYWQEALRGVALQHRLEVELPEQLDTIWLSSPQLSDTERKAQIMALWTSRTCTPEGKEASVVIGNYMAYEIHPTSPFTTEEITSLHNKNICGFSLPDIQITE